MPAHRITWSEMMDAHIKREAQPCANPECRKMFIPHNSQQVYCGPNCKFRMEYKRRAVRRMNNRVVQAHPCRRCGKPVIDGRKRTCDACQGLPPAPGVADLDTHAIRTNRQREAELIDLVVSQAKAREVDYYKTESRPRLSGVRVG